MPIIAITSNYGDQIATLAQGYYQSLRLAGATPVIVPPTSSAAEVETLLENCDGLLLSGGGDLNPLLVGEEPLPTLHDINGARDGFELLITRRAVARHMPILGICRGVQVLAAAMGGRVAQDIATCLPGEHIKHSQKAERYEPTHTVEAAEGSTIAQILGKRFVVNSFHHQAVSSVAGTTLRVSATAPDGVIEAIESADGGQIIGVQWHPETFCLAPDDAPQRTAMQPLFEHFVEDCRAYARARDFHRRHFTIDSHCDTPMLFAEGAVNFAEGDARALVDWPKMRDGGLDAICMVAYLQQRDGLAPEAYTAEADSLLTRLRQMIDATPHAAIARSRSEMMGNKARGIKSIVCGIENGAALGGKVSNVARYAAEGIAYITLCHNGHNDLCDSARPLSGQPKALYGGLSPLGREVVKAMNASGILVDLSHAAESTFYDALEASTTPIFCSHSSSRALCNHPRNLTDDQLRALAEHGGVAQATFYHGFLRDDEATHGAATVEDAVRHILHMIDVAGIEHVGIGSDFDGDGGVSGLADASYYTTLTRHLMAEGLTESDLALLWGGNLLRLIFPLRP